MRIFAPICTLVLATLLFAAPSQGQSIELFGGYSFVRAPVTFTQTAGACPITGCPVFTNTQNLNLNGWEAGGAFKVLGPLALAADFSGTFGHFRVPTLICKPILPARSFVFPDRFLPSLISSSARLMSQSARAPAR